MTKANDSAFSPTNLGLTKHEYFAAMAMQGLFPTVNIHTDIDDCADSAVKMADALIEALNKDVSQS